MTESFFGKVDASAVNGCWIWQGKYQTALIPLGYGYDPLDAPGRSTTPAYRVAYLLFVGPIPKGMAIQRTCGNHQCVNPKHLKLATRAELGRAVNPRAIQK